MPLAWALLLKSTRLQPIGPTSGVLGQASGGPVSILSYAGSSLLGDPLESLTVYR